MNQLQTSLLSQEHSYVTGCVGVPDVSYVLEGDSADGCQSVRVVWCSPHMEGGPL